MVTNLCKRRKNSYKIIESIDVLATGDLPAYKLIYKQNLKNIRLSFNKNFGSFTVCAPKSASRSDIEKFLKSKQRWIDKSLKSFALAIKHEPIDFIDGEKITIWGEISTLRIVKAKNNSRGYLLKNGSTIVRTSFSSIESAYSLEYLDTADKSITTKLSNSGKELYLITQEPHNIEKLKLLWNNFLNDELKAQIDKRLNYFESITGLKCESYSIRKMKTRWGSCTPATKKIRFSNKLALYPPQCLDMVIVHELGHIKFPNHGSGFKEHMGKYYPNYKCAEKLLKN